MPPPRLPDAGAGADGNGRRRRGAGRVELRSRPAFRRLARAGEVDGQTRVFDLTADTVGALRRNGLERPAAESWHGRAFRLAPLQQA